MHLYIQNLRSLASKAKSIKVSTNESVGVWPGIASAVVFLRLDGPERMANELVSTLLKL
jgi:hypothetical protein